MPQTSLKIDLKNNNTNGYEKGLQKRNNKNDASKITKQNN